MPIPRKKRLPRRSLKSVIESPESVVEPGLENALDSIDQQDASDLARALLDEQAPVESSDVSATEIVDDASRVDNMLAAQSPEPDASVDKADAFPADDPGTEPAHEAGEETAGQSGPVLQIDSEPKKTALEGDSNPEGSAEEPVPNDEELENHGVPRKIDEANEGVKPEPEPEPEPAPDLEVEVEPEPEPVPEPEVFTELPHSTEPVKAKKPNFLVRFWRWLTSPFRRKSHVELRQPVPVEVFDEEWAKSAVAELRELQNQRIAASNSAERIHGELSLLQHEQVRIETWLEGLKRSYYWKLEQRMGQNLEQAKSDIAEYESLVRDLELPEKGRLRSLREKFHKGLIVNFLSFAVPVFLLYFIPWFSRVDLFGWLVDLLRSPLLIVLVVTIGTVVGGVFLLLRKVLGPKKVPWNKTLKWTAISMLIPALIYALFRFKDFLLVFVTPVIEEIRPTIILVILILFTFLTLALLIIYYQGWSVFRRVVTEEMSRLDNVVAGYVRTRQELARLEFLYGQTIDWMKLLAHTLYRPWKIHPDWKSPNQAQAASESFPLALRVAQAVENDASESAQLRRTIAHRLLVQGWRTSAFERSLSEIGRYLGYEPDKVNPELLDSDLPHQPNKARKLVLEYFEHSANTSQIGKLDLSNQPADPESVGSKPLPSDVYLVEVARDHLKYLIEKTQGSALAQARPSVQQVVSNPLGELTESDTETETVEVSGWDEFLAEGLGIGDQTQPPIGVLAFTNEGRNARSPEGVTSQVLVPGRFAKSLPNATAANLKVLPMEDTDQNQPAELMLRFDVVGPLPFKHVTLVQNANTVPVANFVPDEENDDL
jgi:hypothetical protein